MVPRTHDDGGHELDHTKPLAPCPRRYHVLEKMTAHKAGGAAEMEEVLGILMSLKPDVLKFGAWRGRFHAPSPSCSQRDGWG